MRKSNFALRRQPSLMDEARKVAEAEGVALNQFINVAVAEKLSALRTESNFRERAERADIPKALDILKRAGKGKPPSASGYCFNQVSRPLIASSASSIPATRASR
jgi:hypothetical protein